MSTDLLTDLAEYGQVHRETQKPIRPAEAARRAVTQVPVRRRPRYWLRRLGAALIAAALVTAFISIPALLHGPETEGPADFVVDTTPLSSPSTADDTTEITAPPEPESEPRFEGLTMVHSLGDEGTLVGLSELNVWRSEDGGGNLGGMVRTGPRDRPAGRRSRRCIARCPQPERDH